MRIGLYGGCFNPIHNGHMFLAETAMKELKLDEIIFIPCGNSAYGKEDMIPAYLRFLMVDQAIAWKFRFDISDVEVDDEVSYTINTVKYFKKNYPKDELIWICGHDSFKKFKTWKDYKEIKNYAQVMFAGKDFECHELNIRSSLIREMIKQGKNIKYLVPNNVVKFVKRIGAYL